MADDPLASDDRWRRVQELYHEMLGHTREEQAVALAAACSSEPGLAAEVQSLLRIPRVG